METEDESRSRLDEICDKLQSICDTCGEIGESAHAALSRLEAMSALDSLAVLRPDFEALHQMVAAINSGHIVIANYARMASNLAKYGEE